MGKSNISLRDWIDILYRWSNEESMVLIRKSLTISTPTLVKVFKLFRECINKYFNINPVKFGDDNVVYQVVRSISGGAVFT